MVTGISQPISPGLKSRARSARMKVNQLLRLQSLPAVPKSVNSNDQELLDDTGHRSSIEELSELSGQLYIAQPTSRIGESDPIQPAKDSAYTLIGEPTRGIVISRDMTVSEIIPHLISSGCRNVTNEIDLNQCGDFPIAGGGFGDIYQGGLLRGAKVAIKCPRLFLVNDDKGNSVLKSITREVYTWSKLKHPNLLELVGFATFRGHIAVLSPWMDNGTLPTYLGRYPDVDRFQICLQISAGLAYLHTSDIVHGDLKGANVLVSEAGIVKLTDFGNTVLKKYTLEFSGTATSSKISVRWTAPEILSGDSAYTKEADLYALGMTFLETMTGKVPFSEKVEQAVMFLVANKKTPGRPTELEVHGSKSHVLWTIMTQCWSYNSADRPTVLGVERDLSLLIATNTTTNTEILLGSTQECS